jgi:hypothetical protein
MKRIEKYIIDEPCHDSFTRLNIPKGGKVFACTLEDHEIAVWAVVNPKNEKKERWFGVFTDEGEITGYDKKCYEYIDTVPDKDEVYHIFEVHD